MKSLPEFLQIAVERSASDLHIIPGYYPTIRVNDELFAIRTEAPFTAESATQIIYSILNQQQQQVLQQKRQHDFSYLSGNRRFRANIYFVRGAPAATFRVVPEKIKTIQELMLPQIFSSFAKMRSGFVLITGPTGVGKSTTLASIINDINLTKAKHIITIEDPIEYVYPVAKSIISQRELNSDTYSFAEALRATLREDPDVVLVGEMRDYETIQAALTLAETGHLVVSTLHTSTTPEAINRMIDVFPVNQQSMVRSQLSSTLKAVVSQQLVPMMNVGGRIPAVEILLNTKSVASAIREGKLHMIDNILETSEQEGMILLEKYLYRLQIQGQISKETAYSFALRPKEIDTFFTQR